MSHTSRNHLTCDNHAMHTCPRIHYCNKKFFRGLRKVKTRRGWHSSVSLLPCHHCQADKSLCIETRPSLRNSWKTCQSSSTRGDVSSRSRQMADADPTWKEQGKRGVSRIAVWSFVRYPLSLSHDISANCDPVLILVLLTTSHFVWLPRSVLLPSTPTSSWPHGQGEASPWLTHRYSHLEEFH